MEKDEIPPLPNEVKALVMHIQYRTGQQDQAEQIRRALKMYLDIFNLHSQGYHFAVFKPEPGKMPEMQIVEDWEF